MDEKILVALEKQVPKKVNHVRIEHGKHTWQRDEDGEIDTWAYESGFCNGVICEVCGKVVCVHCDPDYDEDEGCVEEHYDCPVCGKRQHLMYKDKYCNECGQKLDWD